MSKVTAQISYQEENNNINSSTHREFSEIIELVKFEELKREKYERLEEAINKYLIRLKDPVASTTFSTDEMETSDSEPQEFGIDIEGVEINEFIEIPPKKHIIIEYEIKELKKAKPVIFDEEE